MGAGGNTRWLYRERAAHCRREFAAVSRSSYGSQTIEHKTAWIPGIVATL